MSTNKQEHQQSNDPTLANPPSADDPRLAIPEVLRTPIKHPSLEPKPAPAALSGLGDLGKALAIGLDFLFSIAAAGLVGYLLDRWQGWSPAGLLIGLGVGFAAATVRILQRLNREEAKSKARRSAK